MLDKGIALYWAPESILEHKCWFCYWTSYPHPIQEGVLIQCVLHLFWDYFCKHSHQYSYANLWVVPPPPMWANCLRGLHPTGLYSSVYRLCQYLKWRIWGDTHRGKGHWMLRRFTRTRSARLRYTEPTCVAWHWSDIGVMVSSSSSS